MTLESIRQAIEARFIAQWAGSHVAFENVQYRPPDETQWVRLSVQPLTNAYNGLGECREIIGIVGVQIYSPLRSGTKQQEQSADAAVTIFTGSHDTISYRDATITSVGEVDGWYQYNVLVEFTAKG